MNSAVKKEYFFNVRNIEGQSPSEHTVHYFPKISKLKLERMSSKSILEKTMYKGFRIVGPFQQIQINRSKFRKIFIDSIDAIKSFSKINESIYPLLQPFNKDPVWPLLQFLWH